MKNYIIARDRFRMFKQSKKIIMVIITISTMATGCLTACDMPQRNNNCETADIFAMDTYMSLTCNGEKAKEAIDEAISCINRLDELLSVGNENSEVYKINHGESIIASEDVISLASESLKMYELTDGDFDATIYPMMELWGFTKSELYVPTEDEIKIELSKCGSGDLIIDKKQGIISIPDDGGIDFGAIAKGYTADKIVEIFDKYKVDSAIISLGGNIYAYGVKPSGEKWTVGVKSPYAGEDQGVCAMTLEVSDTSVVTSGTYERKFVDEKTGKIYHHIIDPHTGRPADTDIISATIVCKSGTLADMVSTTLVVKGKDKAIEFWREHKDMFDMILITEEDEIYLTKGIKNDFNTDSNVVVLDE